MEDCESGNGLRLACSNMNITDDRKALRGLLVSALLLSLSIALMSSSFSTIVQGMTVVGSDKPDASLALLFLWIGRVGAGISGVFACYFFNKYFNATR